jgi:hypothetical protein
MDNYDSAGNNQNITLKNSTINTDHILVAI